MFSTTEDLFTQTIVVPYLIPMLENAGAVVFTPRERDMQIHEVIVDNDTPTSGYSESTLTGRWKNTRTAGFHITDAVIPDGYNPFEKGTSRSVPATRAEDCSRAAYQPTLPESGRYAVYVSYTTEKNSVDDAHYTVYHKGRKTVFHVNQKMGGGTWVYLGTFDFDKGSSRNNRVVLSAHSSSRGVVTTDAVRFGGGMGNILRGGKVSHMPRFLEGARYYAQWAGAPRKVYAVYDGQSDYKEDINVRSLMTNWLSGGSPYNPDSMNINPYDTIYSAVMVHDTIHVSVPDTVSGGTRDTIEIRSHQDTIPTGFRHFEGKKVPLDLSLAIHSDAGFRRDMTSIVGSLTICTTDYNDSLLNARLPREHSKDFAMMLLADVSNDLNAVFGNWQTRGTKDSNYSETRLPGIPSAIIETLSHQSFPDMRLAHDPMFKFTMARAIYKTILRYEAAAHGTVPIVQPLSPTAFSAQMSGHGMVTLSWQAQQDSLESTATPTGYNVYTSVGHLGYDNGKQVKECQYTMQLTPDSLYRFRVTATNDGGESFPTEELCVLYHGAEAKTILIVNGFNRLSSPAVVDSVTVDPANNDHELYYKGFDINDDPGLSYGPTACWSGRQKVFCTVTVGREGPGTFGYSGQELQGKTIAGNDFNYVSEHAEAIAGVTMSHSSKPGYNIVSTSREAVEQGMVDLSQYACVDLILGNEKNDGHSLRPYKTFTPALISHLSSLNSRLIISGSFVASDLQSTPEDSVFLADVLHCALDTVVRTVNDSITVTGQRSLALIHTLNPQHYATIQSDVLCPLRDAIPVMRYSDGSIAAISVPKKTIVMGFPFECIEDRNQRALLMQRLLLTLLKQ